MINANMLLEKGAARVLLTKAPEKITVSPASESWACYNRATIPFSPLKMGRIAGSFGAAEETEIVVATGKPFGIFRAPFAREPGCAVAAGPGTGM